MNNIEDYQPRIRVPEQGLCNSEQHLGYIAIGDIERETPLVISSHELFMLNEFMSQ